jgi:hypothetical protein
MRETIVVVFAFGFPGHGTVTIADPAPADDIECHLYRRRAVTTLIQ